MRDDFSIPVKETLAKRVSLRCSNPACRKPTSGPQEDPAKSINIGVAAHITAASADGPRYDPRLPVDGRKSASNGIWLCQSCAKLVDNDSDRYTVETLHRWKTVSEAAALRALESRNHSDPEVMFLRLEQLMPDLLDEFRKDLKKSPLSRDFIVRKKTVHRAWTYIPNGDELCYYYEDHAELDKKLQILQNNGMVRDMTHTRNGNVKHYLFTESFTLYLGA